MVLLLALFIALLLKHIDFHLGGVLIEVSGQGSQMNHRFLVGQHTAYFSVK